ncbi:MAG: hypothetical protein ACRD1T_01540 [Acidimicrobiia bacterium]
MTLMKGLVAISLAGAAAIHFIETPSHFREDALYGWFFVFMGAAQAVGALLLLVKPRGILYGAVALGNTAIVALWVVTRTIGVPLGAESGSVESARVSDVTATLFELVAICGSIILLSKLARRTQSEIRSHSAVSISAVSILGAVITAATLAVVISASSSREACTHFDPKFGPLAAVDGHSLLPRGTPAVSIVEGEDKDVLAGLLVNCGSDPVAVRKAEVVSDAGDAAVVRFLVVLPKDHKDGEVSTHHTSASSVPVLPTDEHPEMAVFAEVQGLRQGQYFLNGLRITYEYRGKISSQIFATNIAFNVGAG